MGTRIRDVADDVPKPMVPSATPVLWHIMKSYASHGSPTSSSAGPQELGHQALLPRLPPRRRRLSFRLGRPDEVSITPPAPAKLAHHLRRDGLKAMTGCRVKRIEEVHPRRTFLLTYGDGVSDVNIGDLVKFHQHMAGSAP